MQAFLVLLEESPALPHRHGPLPHQPHRLVNFGVVGVKGHAAGVRGEAVAAPAVDAALPSCTHTSRWMSAGHDLRMQSGAGRSCWPID